MSSRWFVLLGAAVVTLIMLVSSLGLVNGLTGTRAASPDLAAGASTPTAPTHSTPAPTGPRASVTPIHATSPAGATPPGRTSDQSAPVSSDGAKTPQGLASAEAAISSGEVDRSSVFLPRSPALGSPLTSGGPITGPTYPSVPAPMGLSDVGQGASGPYEYNTSSFASTMTLNSFADYNPGYSAWEATPDWMTFQLNTVTDNVSYPGATNGTFWIQNVVHFNGTTLEFEDNVWNFSSEAACLEPGTIFAHGPNGTEPAGACFYYAYGSTYTVTYPFTLTLYNNITILDGNDTVFFNFTITNASGTESGTFDFVQFNGVASSLTPPQFQVNGFNYNPTGYLVNDAEIILGGNGGGSQALISEINATTQLQFWNASSGSYQSIPSAYDYGADTGETSQGVAATYSGTTENLTQGPSMLYGLWNTTDGVWGPAASSTVSTLTMTGLPTYGFAFVENVTDYLAGGDNWSYWPGASDGVWTTKVPYLPGSGPYCIAAFANGYENTSFCTPGNVSFVEALAPDASVFNTPVYLSTDAQAAAFGSSGASGVAYNGEDLWINDTVSTFAAPFRLGNDYLFPSFVLFAEDNLSVNVYVNNLTQNASADRYTTDGRGDWNLPQYSQGYYFNFGTGVFEVSNVSIPGNMTLFYLTHEGAYQIQAIEFWDTTGSNASNILSFGDNFGVDVYYSTDIGLYNISAGTGANAVLVYESVAVTVYDVEANGTDIELVPTYGVIFEYSEDVFVAGVTATNGSLGVYIYDLLDAEFYEVSVFTNAIAFEAEEVLGLEVVDLTISASPTPAYGVYIAYGEDVDLFSTDIQNSSGVELYDLIGLEIEGLVVTGLDATGFGPVFGEFIEASDVGAYDGAYYALFVADSLFVNITGVVAASGSVGVSISATEDTLVQDIDVSGDSIGTSAYDDFNVTSENVTVTSGGLGVFSFDNDWSNVTNYNASETALSTNYWPSAYEGLDVPTAAIYSLDDGNDSFYNGSVLNYNYGVVANDSTDLLVSFLAEWNGVIGLVLNVSDAAVSVYNFLYGNQIGIWANDTGGFAAVLDTIEGSSSYGVWVNGGAFDFVEGDNFVANNGASTDGVYSSAHVQAFVSASAATTITVADNYWSDWTSGPYVISTSPSVEDATPESVFITNWLLFLATGLPVGTPWTVTLDGVDFTATVPLIIIPDWSLSGPLLYYTVDAAGYAATPNAGVVSDVGTNQTVRISFSALAESVTFSETGLASGAPWSATLNGVTLTGAGSTIEFTTVVGTYDWSVSAAGYSTTTPSGSVTVTSSGASVDVAFTAIPTYAVTFTESGLTSGTSWTVTLGGVPESSTGPTIVFDEPAGSYTYTVGAVTGYLTPAGGSVTVTNAAQGISVTFTPVTPPTTYTLTFTESGLTTGSSWTVTVNGVTYSSSTSSIAVSGLNGTYTYTVGSVSGFTVSPASGTETVTSADQSVSVTYTPVTTPVTSTITFTETGLPTGTSWSLTVNGVTYTATTSTITVTGVAGEYTYSVGAVTGYTSSPSSGTVTLTSSGASQAIAFSAIPSTTTPSSSSSLSNTDWAIIGLIIGLVIGGLVVALLMRGRGGSGAGTEPQEPVQTWNEGEQAPAEEQPEGQPSAEEQPPAEGDGSA